MSFCILSIDGGGIRGVVVTRMLEAIANRLNLSNPLVNHFDMVTGTSTGAIVASGLVLGKSPGELLDLYLRRGREIFPYTGWLNPKRLNLLWKYGLSAPKFSDQGLIQVIQQELGMEKRLADISPDRLRSQKLMIISYDTVSREPVVFKSWRHEEWYASVPLWEACVCSASAPVYFPAHRLIVDDRSPVQDRSMIDGGIGANNPSACAVAEAIRLLRTGKNLPVHAQESMDQIVNEIRILSLGTGELGRSLSWQEIRGWGALQWGTRLVDVILDAPADIHAYITRQILSDAMRDDPYHHLRLQPVLDQKFGAIDNTEPAYLRNLIEETDAYLDTQWTAIEAFFQS